MKKQTGQMYNEITDIQEQMKAMAAIIIKARRYERKEKKGEK